MAFVAILAAPLLAACGSSDSEGEEFAYGEPEMRSLILGKWTGTVTLEGKPESAYEMILEQAPPGAEAACESRTFAHATCTPQSSMSLIGALTSADATFAATPVRGSLIAGLKLDHADLELIAGGASFHARREGSAFVDGSISGELTGTFTMTRE